MRYEPGFSVDLLEDVAVPLGEYDSDQALNIGQNRWYGRVGAPIVWQLGAWVPGRRTTLEFLPSVWVFGDNSDFLGRTLQTDPMVQVEGHLTRDLSKHLWGALDGTWITGGKATIGGATGDDLNNLGVGFTLGYQVNDNLSATLGYMATVNDSEPEDLKLNGFRFSVVFGGTRSSRASSGSGRGSDPGASASRPRGCSGGRDGPPPCPTEEVRSPTRRA
mgnify:CR=1 FL=1